MDCKKNLKNGGRDVFPVALGLISQIVEPRPQVFKFLLSKSSTMIIEISLWKLIFCHKVWEKKKKKKKKKNLVAETYRGSLLEGDWALPIACFDFDFSPDSRVYRFRIVLWHVFPFHATSIPTPIIKFLDFWNILIRG